MSALHRPASVSSSPGLSARPTVYSSVSAALVRAFVEEMLDPLVRLFMDFATALLLGVSFLIQTVSFLIACDTTLIHGSSVIATGLATLLSTYLRKLLVGGERERMAFGKALMQNFLNVVWMATFYGIDLSKIPWIAVGSIMFLHSTLRLLSVRMEEAPSKSTVFLFLAATLIQWAQLMRVSMMPSSTDAFLDVLLLLRGSINGMCNVIDALLLAYSPTVNMAERTDLLSVDISRAFFWACLSYHLIPLKSGARPVTGAIVRTPSLGWRVFYSLAFCHDLLGLVLPTFRLIMKISHDFYIAAKFPRLSPEELREVETEMCSVCLTEHNRETVRLPCNHLLHSSCLNRILQQRDRVVARCPICRANLSDSDLEDRPHSHAEVAAEATNRMVRVVNLGRRTAAQGIAGAAAAVAGTGADLIRLQTRPVVLRYNIRRRHLTRSGQDIQPTTISLDNSSQVGSIAERVNIPPSEPIAEHPVPALAGVSAIRQRTFDRAASRESLLPNTSHNSNGRFLTDAERFANSTRRVFLTVSRPMAAMTTAYTPESSAGNSNRLSTASQSTLAPPPNSELVPIENLGMNGTNNSATTTTNNNNSNSNSNSNTTTTNEGVFRVEIQMDRGNSTVNNDEVDDDGLNDSIIEAIMAMSSEEVLQQLNPSGGEGLPSREQSPPRSSSGVPEQSIVEHRSAVGDLPISSSSVAEHGSSPLLHAQQQQQQQPVLGTSAPDETTTQQQNSPTEKKRKRTELNVGSAASDRPNRNRRRRESNN